MTRLLLSALLAAAVLAWGARPQSADEVFERSRRATDALRSYSAEYVLVQKSDTVRGTVAWRRPSCLRFWHRGTLVVRNDEMVWFYTPAANAVVVGGQQGESEGEHPDRGTPLVSLGDVEVETVSLADAERVGERECEVLDVIPTDTSLVRAMRFWIDRETWVARRVRYVDHEGGITAYTLSNIDLDPDLHDSTFTFYPPPGVLTTDLRSSGP